MEEVKEMKGEKNMRWFLRIKLDNGRTFIFPYYGYKTKREAESQLELAKRCPEHLSVELIKGKW